MATEVAQRAPTDEEQRLAAAAAAGDGEAFATLYERYEQRAYNLAYRITGSEEDAADAVQDAFLGVLRRLPAHGAGELAFGSYVFTATRNACYDLMQKRRRAEPSDSIPESATPVGGGAGGLGLDPGDPEDDPSRRQFLRAQRSEIREANSRLPERQREALALRELEGLSYDEIAEIMGMNRNSVAQLISRARLNLRAELRGTALESVATSSADCERAMPLIACRDDGQLEDGAEASWLGAHLAACGACQVRVEAMHEAGASYRAWAPIPAVPWLFEETMARAAELVGADWSEAISTRAAARGGGSGAPSRRRWALVGGSLLTLLLAGLLLARAVDDRGTSEELPVVEGRTVDAAADSVRAADAKEQKGKQPSTHDAPVSAASVPAQEASAAEPSGTTPPAGGGSRDTDPERSVSRSEPTETPQRKEGPAATPEEAPLEEPEAVPPPAPEPEPPVREPEQPPKEPPPPGKPPTGPPIG